MKKLTELFDIDYPIIQAGMVWVSGAKLAAAAANAGILGLIGAGSMKPPLLREHIQKAKSLTKKSFGVNVPLLYEGAQEQIEVALEEGVRIFFTSAGSPKKFTSYLKEKGAIVVHVCSSPALAVKCQEAGVDAVVAEGFEAGGHNGRDELTTLVLVPQVVDAVTIPVIAAGGIIKGCSIAAALCLGAQGVQMGTRFIAAKESSAHPNFRRTVVEATPDATMLCMKSVVPVRLVKNAFFEKIAALEAKAASPDEIKALLGKGRARRGMLEGDLEEGELEIGQGASMVKKEQTVQEIVTELIREYELALQKAPQKL